MTPPPGAGADGFASRTPTRLAISLPTAMREAIVEHCRSALPNEGCGLVAGDAPPSRGGRPTRWLPARNVLASPRRYELHPDDLVRLTLDIDAVGEVVWAIVHSHVATPAIPSPTDLRQARYPDALQLVVSFAGNLGPTGSPDLRAWRILEGALEEVATA